MATRTDSKTLGRAEKLSFKRNGFLVIRDAFDEELITRAREALWDAIPEERTDPASWFEREGDHDEILHRGSDSTAGANLPTVEPFEEIFRGVYPYAEALVGEGLLAGPEQRPAEYCLHGGHLMASREDGDPVVDHDGAVGPILQYPADIRDDTQAAFDPHEMWHVDGGTGPYVTDETVSYLPFTIACAVYFDTVEPRGGGFTVWPRSHRRIPEYFAEHDYADYVAGDSDPLEELGLDPGIEITGGPGTLVLWHHGIVHGASPNHSERIRMAGFQRIARSDIADLGQSGLSDPWRHYDAIEDLEPAVHDAY